MCSHKQEGRAGASGTATPATGRVSDATMTLWRRSVEKDSTSEDSIRISTRAVTAALKTTPRPRLLASNKGSGSDFDLGEKLGSGGVGVVYSATQTALGRDVAVKMVKPDRRGSAVAADALMAEAVLTGHLEHPNIVPVYDLGVDAEGNLFYAMKEVQGLPWSQVMCEKTQDENLEILLRVTDTVSFAHSRGVLHRDLKPHNIMLGEFGEVMVMDWGASCRMADAGRAADQSTESSFCGTPAYMPPEMARGDASRLSEASDVYLLGAILYQMITGHPPRTEKDPVLCLSQAAENHIEPTRDGELYRIAMKAMASAPADRFPDVRSFQRAIQNYRSHSESLRVAENAAIHWRKAKYEKDYDLFSRAVFGFREALDLWPQNSEAEQMKKQVTSDYARCAFENNDLELAQSLLDPSDPTHGELLDLIGGAIADRDAQRRRHRRLLVTARLLGAGLLVIFSVAFFLIRSEQQKTKAQHRESLINLISAHYGEQNYEAAIETFWELHDQYGMESLNEELLLNVRVAAAMNPSRGTFSAGLNDPLGFVASIESNCVWVAGRKQIKKIRLGFDPGYDPETLVKIHDFQFGKRREAGQLTESIRLPAEISSSAAVFESSNGVLWAGCGSTLWRYSRQTGTWAAVLDVRELELNPLSSEYGYAADQAEEFFLRMKTFGRERTITGVLINRDQSRAAVVLGGETVCWIDLHSQRCLGWFFTGMETGWEEKPVQSGPKLALSPDESWLLFRDASGGSFVYTFELPDLIRRGYYYGRDHAIRDIAFDGSNRFFGLNDWHGTVFSPDKENFSRYRGVFDSIEPWRWGPDYCAVRTLPARHWHLAVLNADVLECAVITSDSKLFAGSLCSANGPDLLVNIMNRKWVGGLIPTSGLFCALDESGVLHIYSTHRFAVQSVVEKDLCVGVCAGGDAATYYGLFEANDGKRKIIKVRNADTKAPATRVLVPVTDAVELFGDPSGQFVAALVAGGIRVYDAQSGRELFYIPRDRPFESPIIRFDALGRYMAVSGRWSKWLLIYRTSDWKCILAENEPAYLDVEIDCDADGSGRILLTQGHLFEGRRIEDGRVDSSNLLWQIQRPSSLNFIIPSAQGQPGDQFCWLGGWFDVFWKVDLNGNGRELAKTMYWFKKGVRMPVYGADSEEVFFEMEDGQVQMVLKSDLLPVADPRLFGEDVSDVAPSHDGSMVALVRDGHLELMNLDEWIEEVPHP
jgi:serine/threonine protein kinase